MEFIAEDLLSELILAICKDIEMDIFYKDCKTLHVTGHKGGF